MAGKNREKKNLESIGLAKNKLTSQLPFVEFFSYCGRKKMTVDELTAYNQKFKEKELIMARNNKQRAVKKPEEPVPWLDPVEQDQETGE